jgi:DNA (cytosine-5)-methyltransferase 1
VIVVGVRDSLKFSYPSPTHSNKVENSGDLFDADLLPYVTLGEAIGDLPLIESNSSAEAYICEPQNSYQKQMRIGAPKQIMDHSASPHGESLMSVIRHVPEGGVKADIPPEFRPLSGFPNSYSRLWWNKPSTTITRNLGTPSSARCIHPLCDRGLTTREGARLQSFPDRFKFSGNRSKRNLQVGNAVPPLLALALALQVKQAFR